MYERSQIRIKRQYLAFYSQKYVFPVRRIPIATMTLLGISGNLSSLMTPFLKLCNFSRNSSNKVRSNILIFNLSFYIGTDF
ncbi:MAG: hypothetical protein A2X70_04990 [Alphaproteobacteria bacterium GWC2_42_16]|nr:MAG: hypothetical protein A2X70_04990 [Alphaproteobacteria bacterium GWC2_42_16]